MTTPSNKNTYSCPLRMSDGRSMTDYRPKCIVNYELMNTITDNNLVKSSFESRLYLQQNADEIMKNEMQKSINNLVPCVTCEKPLGNGTLLPEKYIVSCDAISCTKKPFNQNGLGDGREGTTSLLLN